MFCPKCGAQIAPGSAFCENCGTPLASRPQPSAPTYQSPTPASQSPAPVYQPPAIPEESFSPPPKPKKKFPLIAAIGGGIGALALIVVLLVVFVFNSEAQAKRVATKYFRAFISADGPSVLTIVHPDVIEIDAELFDMTIPEYGEYISGNFREIVETQWKGPDTKARIKVIDVHSVVGQELRNTQEAYADSYDLTIDECLNVKCEITSNGITDERDIDVVKIGSRWYIR